VNRKKNYIAKLISFETGTEEFGLIKFIYFVTVSHWMLPLHTLLHFLQDIILCLFESEVSWHIIYAVNIAELVKPITLGTVSFLCNVQQLLKVFNILSGPPQYL
jgi:hypothetical protein